MPPQTRITELAAVIQRDTAIVDSYLTSHDLPTPSLDINAPPMLPIPDSAPEVQAAHASAIAAAAELQALLIGPAELLRPKHNEHVSLQAIVRFNIDRAFPVNSAASYASIAQSTGLSERNVRRLLRHAMTFHLFREPEKGFVAHTALTRLLAEDDELHDTVAHHLDEFWPAAVRVVDAMEKWPGSEEPNQTGFSLANDTDKTMWEVFADDPARGQRFGRAMSGLDRAKGYEPHLLLDGYPWGSIGKGTVVDVGGSHGSVAISLAERFPDIRCVVQDLPEVVEEGKKKLPGLLGGRVEFMSHDFFTDQPVVADIYYFRSIFHNWADKYAIEILRRLIPALGTGARIVISDAVLPEPGTLPATEERRVRTLDVTMLQLLNSYQRDEDEWRSLFRSADTRFRYVGSTRMPGATQSIIEVVWEG